MENIEIINTLFARQNELILLRTQEIECLKQQEKAWVALSGSFPPAIGLAMSLTQIRGQAEAELVGCKRVLEQIKDMRSKMMADE